VLLTDILQTTDDPEIRVLARGFPVIALTAPRQSGKTTLAREVSRTRPMPSHTRCLPKHCLDGS
jgi:hypothetical protein